MKKKYVYQKYMKNGNGEFTTPSYQKHEIEYDGRNGWELESVTYYLGEENGWEKAKEYHQEQFKRGNEELKEMNCTWENVLIKTGRYKDVAEEAILVFEEN